ncbi:MAG: hypothetical protein NWE80_05015, partial [Candidatus Bathyarchaeota archaeon]|nr:hypothetical protein [Candidatus Bathyarchaeota archaeon]
GGERMKKKILVTVLIAALMLATLLIGVALAGYGGKNVATYEWEVQQWPLLRNDPPPEDMMVHEIEKKSGTMLVYQKIHTYGAPPLVDNINLPPPPTPPATWNPKWDDYPNGGIRLTVTPAGEDPYTLVGSFEKVFLWIVYQPKGAAQENAKWSFTITAVEDGVAPAGAVGSTMYGTLIKSPNTVTAVIKSTKGTGIFEGAFLRGTHTTSWGVVHESFPPTGTFALFTWSEGSGKIVFP